jgi:multiple sugar transport system substrate-binding protein
MRKWYAWIAVMLMMCLLVAGCGGGTNKNNNGGSTASPPAGSEGAGGEEPRAGKPFEGVSIRFLMANHPWIETLTPLVPEFEKSTGIKVNIETYATDQVSSKLAVELTSKSDSLDVMFIRPLDEKKLFMQNGWLEPLDAYVADDADYGLDDFIPSALDTVTYENTLIALPITTEREILYYRKDIFEQHNLQPPATLDELMQIAAQLHDPDNDFFGFVGRGQAVPAVTQFSGYLHSFGGQFQDGNTATLNTPEALAAFEFYGKLLGQYGPPGAINMSWPEAAALFAQGMAAMFIDADAIYLNVADPEKSTVSEHVGYATFPAGPAGAKPFNVVSGALAVSAYSKNKEAAAEFIKWATSKEIVLKTQSAGNPGARMSVWGNPESTQAYPPELVETINKSSSIGVGIDRPQVINVALARQIIGRGITDAIEGKDMKSVLESVQKEFQNLIDDELNGN